MTAAGSEQNRERIYAMLAAAVDDIDPDRERLFLAKAALLLALTLDDPKAVGNILSRCRHDL
jgi:hypothetical protein